jgi:AraC-like DNA-binding protein
MVDIGQPVRDPDRVGAPAPSPTLGRLGVKTRTLHESIGPAGRLDAPQLLDHHVLLLTTAGHGNVEVDFTAYPCRPGTLVWARPGQVLYCPAGGGLDAVLVCWSAALPLLDGDPAGDPTGPTHWQLAGEDEDAVINEVSQLVVDCQRHHEGDLPVELLHHQLAVLTLRIAALSGPEAGSDDGPVPEDATAENDVFRRFRRAVERFHAQTRRVEDYAAMLGCSVRTLTRASLSATGRSAKQVVDDRVALQACRLLAATDAPVAEIGHRLGFPEPTNFGRFFHREIGSSPGGFRAAARQRPPRVPTQRVPHDA